jgi:hypothetical protein
LCCKNKTNKEKTKTKTYRLYQLRRKIKKVKIQEVLREGILDIVMCKVLFDNVTTEFLKRFVHLFSLCNTPLLSIGYLLVLRDENIE